MKHEIFIAVKYLQNRKRQTLVSLLGITLGVSFFIAIAAMMKGMQIYFVNQIVDVAPHIIIKDEYRTPLKQPAEIYYPDSAVNISNLKPKTQINGIRNHERIAKTLDQDKNIKYELTLTGQAILKYGNTEIAGTVIGIKPEDEKKVGNIENNMLEGGLDNLQTTTNGIVVGIGLANKLGIKYGDRLRVISPEGIILTTKIVGIFSTGITAIDYTETYMMLKKVQILQNRENTINFIKIKLNDPNLAEKKASEFEKIFKYRTESWQETNQNIFSIFNIQNGIMFSTIGAILVVSSFGIFNIISTVVNEKVRDIAILRSIGFSKENIIHIYLYQGIIVGLVGGLLGWVLGYVFLEMLENVEFKVEGESFIRLDGFYLYRSYYLYFIGLFIGMVSTIIASYLPAKKAASVNPVDIIRGAT